VAAPAASPSPAPLMPEPPRAATVERSSGRMSPLVWVGGLVIVVIVILIAFTR
jgi:hypothetical protein